MNFLILIVFSIMFQSVVFGHGLRSHEPISKIYDERRFKSKLSLSTEQIIEQIRREGFVVEEITKSPLSGSWARYFKDNKVQGKYFSPYDSLPEVNQPTLLLIDLDDRWTLLHEYLHGLFDQVRHQSDENFSNKTLEAQKNAREHFLEIYPKRKSVEHRSDIIKAFNDFVQTEIKLSMNLSIEEIMIESILIDIFRKNLDPFLNHKQYLVAVNYRNYNLQIILGHLDVFFRINEELKSLVIFDEDKKILSDIENDLTQLKYSVMNL
ncbi:MAG: hypothetical protein ACK5V3_09610 [Bdellovibrionales bacterium]